MTEKHTRSLTNAMPRRIVSIALTVFLLLMAGCKTQPTQKVILTDVKETFDAFLLNGRQVAVPTLREEGATVQIFDWIVYSWWECRVNWDQTCRGTKTFEVPAGWQACKFLYIEQSRGGFDTTFQFGASNWYTNDPESPDRFRAYVATIGASGSGNIFNQQGAWIRLENVGVRLIPATATNQQRYEAGCHMPPHD